jgi:hypothetical protein
MSSSPGLSPAAKYAIGFDVLLLVISLAKLGVLLGIR